MYSTLVFIALFVASVQSFQMIGSSRKASTLMMAEKSKALPFLARPAKLDGSMPGDFGFDPLGLTDVLPNTYYVQSAELKHSRVAMLAVVGFIFQQYVHIVSPEANPIAAVQSLGVGVNLQILSFIGTIELATWDKTFFGTNPGELGFDPLNFSKGKSKAQMDDLKVKEVKNGRLAMIAIMGLIVQNHATGGASTF